MLIKISLIVAMCSGVSYQDVQKRVLDLQAKNPGTQVSVRLDKKAVCANGMVLSGKDAKLMSELGK